MCCHGLKEPLIKSLPMSLGILVLIYLAGTLAIGWFASTFVHGSSDFFNAGRRLPFVLSSFALFALWFGSETIFGASSEFVANGLLGVIEDPFGACLCLVLFGLFLVRPLYRLNLLTLGDLFHNAYGRKTEYLSSFFMILTFVGYAAAQIIALSYLFETAFGIDPVYGRLASAVIVSGYTAAGGMWAVSLTDFVQSIVIMAGLVFLCVSLSAGLDMEGVFAPPSDYFFDFIPSQHNGMGWMEYLAAWMTLALGSLASQDIFQRANAAKTENIAVYSTLFGAFLYLCFAMLPLYLGLLVYQVDPGLLTEGDGQDMILRLVEGHAPLWLQALFFGALISAVFSTCSGALLAPSSILAENLVRPLLFPDASDAQLLRISRLCVAFMAMLSTIIAFSNDSIYDLVAESSTLGAVSILVPMLYALFSKTGSATGAWLSMICGLLGYLVYEYGMDGFPVPGMFMGMLCSLVGMMAGNFRQAGKPASKVIH
jgi:SSS family solute:Na+ symporter